MASSLAHTIVEFEGGEIWKFESGLWAFYDKDGASQIVRYGDGTTLGAGIRHAMDCWKRGEISSA